MRETEKMPTFKTFWALFLYNCIAISAINQVTASAYTAGVVEYYPNQQTEGLTPEQLIEANTIEYLAYIARIVKETPEIDIIVFPEATLTANNKAINRTLLLNYTTYVVDPTIGLSVCTAKDGLYSQALVNISCAARDHKVYVVINLYEKEDCKSEQNGKQCPEDNYNLYNTDVVFNRNGVVVARYRKWNLFGEYLLDVTNTPDVITFNTDFNVTFGIFTCFDILFPQPALELVRNGVKDFVFTSMWFSEIPYLTAVQVQQKWAQANDVTLIAAGALNTVEGSGGSGIYYRTYGLQNGTIQGENKSKHFTAKIPGKYQIVEDNEATIDAEAELMDNFFLKVDNVSDFTTEIIDTSVTDEIINELCTANKSLCCNFWIRISVDTATNLNNTYTYRYAVFDGIKDYSKVYYGGVTVCGIMACTNSSLESCGQRFPVYSEIEWPITFEFIALKATYRNETNSIQFPNNLQSNLKPLSTSVTDWIEINTSDEKTITRKYRLMKPQKRLLTFAIYGRDFSKDHGPGKDEKPNGSVMAKINFSVIVCSVLFLLLN